MHQRLAKKASALIIAIAVIAVTAACNATTRTDSGELDSSAVLRVGIDLTSGGEPTFDPAQPLVVISGQDMWRNLLFDRLIYRGEDDELTGGLVESWEVIDPLTLELTTREGVTFHDGTPFDAEALKWNWERLLDTETVTVPADFEVLRSMEVVSDRVLRMSYKRPVVNHALRVTMSRSLQYGTVVSPTAVEKMGDDFDDAPVGAGPYEFEDFRPGEALSLRRYDGYWDKEHQKLEGVDFIQVAPGAASISALAADRVDIAPLSAESIAAVEKRDGLSVVSSPIDDLMVLVLNVDKAPFDDVNVRRALMHAIDRDAINEGSFSGSGVVSRFLFYEGSPYHPKKLKDEYAYDPERAKELLAAAGVEPGTEIEVYVQTRPEMSRGAEVLQAQLNEVGLDLKIKVQQNWIPAISTLPQSFMLSVSNFLIPTHWLVTNSIIKMGYANPEFDKLTAAYQGATTDEELYDAYLAVQREIMKDVPVIPIAQEPLVFGVNDRVHDLAMGPYKSAEFRNAWMSK